MQPAFMLARHGKMLIRLHGRRKMIVVSRRIRQTLLGYSIYHLRVSAGDMKYQAGVYTAEYSAA
jgi:hypothetical protein